MGPEGNPGRCERGDKRDKGSRGSRHNPALCSCGQSHLPFLPKSSGACTQLQLWQENRESEALEKAETSFFSNKMSTPRTLRVAALQLNSANFDIQGNLDRALPFVEAAVAGSGAQLVLLPELYSRGYIYERVRSLIEHTVCCAVAVPEHVGFSRSSFSTQFSTTGNHCFTVTHSHCATRLDPHIPQSLWQAAERLDGPTRMWACTHAKRLRIHLGLSFLEADGADFFNTARPPLTPQPCTITALSTMHAHQHKQFPRSSSWLGPTASSPARPANMSPPPSRPSSSAAPTSRRPPPRTSSRARSSAGCASA